VATLVGDFISEEAFVEKLRNTSQLPGHMTEHMLHLHVDPHIYSVKQDHLPLPSCHHDRLKIEEGFCLNLPKNELSATPLVY
jgi:hypothetical protein